MQGKILFFLVLSVRPIYNENRTDHSLRGMNIIPVLTGRDTVRYRKGDIYRRFCHEAKQKNERLSIMKILVIGNSFGTDAVRYLHDIARAAGEDITAVNLYIGGCSLYRHWRNMHSEQKVYEYQINGFSTGLYVSLKEMLLLDEWDWVVMQQCSPESGQYDRYQPYLHDLCGYVKRLCPPARLMLHMTWTFAHGCTRFELTPFSSPEEMLPAVTAAYERAYRDEGFELLLPAGKAMAALYAVYGPDIYRDGFHCNRGYTRYMLSALWFMALTGRDITDNSFRDLDEPAQDEQLLTARRIARETLLDAGLIIHN